MGSPFRSGPDDDPGDVDRGHEGCPNGRGTGDGGDEDQVDLEAQAADASVWLGACRRERERGEPDHAVDAGPIADPGLTEAVASLTVVVDKLAAFEAVGLDGKDLLEVTVALNRQMTRLAAAQAHCAHAYDKSMEWALKARAAGARLSHRLRVPDGHGQVRLGRSLAVMPVTDEAFTAGDITTRHVSKLARFATCERTATAFADDEEMLVGFATKLGWREFCDELAAWELLVDPDGAEQNAAADEANRRVHLSGGIDGTGILDGILTPYGHAVTKAALDRLYDQLLEEDKTEATQRLGRDPSFLELCRTPAQRRHDALVRMAELSQQVDVNAKRLAPLVSVVLGRDTFTDVVARIENTGTIVTPGTVARLFDDHHGDVLIERIIFDGANRVVDISNQRLFTGRLRRAIEVRDRTCAWPGCDTPAVTCHIDHVVEHAAGGETSQTNGQALCGPHNLMKERIRKLNARRHRRRGP